MYTDSQYLSDNDILDTCHGNFEMAREKCRGSNGPQPPDDCDDECRKAQACVLMKKKDDKKTML